MAGLSLAALVAGVSMRLTDALLPRLAREFSVSIGSASQVVTAFAVAYGLSQLLFGPLGDRFGKYRVIGWACLASAMATAASTLAHSLGGLVLGRLVAGVCAAAIIPLAMAWIGDVVPYQQRQAVLARFLMGQVTGFGLGVWAGGYTAEHLDWRTPFWVVAGLFLLMAGVLQAAQRHLPGAGRQAATPATTAAVGQTGSITPKRHGLVGEFAAVLQARGARVVLLTVFLEGLCLFGVFPFMAAHLHQRFGLPLSTAGGLVMLFALGGLVYATTARHLVARLGERRLVWGGALLMAASLGLAANALQWWWAMPACGLLGLGFYMMHNTLQTNATQMAPERRGAAVALFAACFFLGQSSGVAVAGWLLAGVGTTGLLMAGAVGVVLTAWQFNHRRVVLAGATPLPVR